MENIKRFHPGVYLKDALDAMNMTANEFSIRSGITERTISSIINGKVSITFDTAYKLASFFNNSVNYWTNLQNAYEMYVRSEREALELATDGRLIDNDLRKYLRKVGVITKSDNNETIVRKTRSFAGVNLLSSLKGDDALVCFKQQQTKQDKDSFMQNLWVAIALNEARKKQCQKFDKVKLMNSIAEIRNMTKQKPEEFSERLQKIMADSGIAFVYIPHLSRSRIYGATKWLNSQNVMLAISSMSTKADTFWFTLFHEISHVLMEHKREMLINVEGVEDDEANSMAADMLIPKDQWKRFISAHDFSETAIFAFAQKVDILPCIVLCRLHKEKYLQYNVLNKSINLSYNNLGSLEYHFESSIGGNEV